MDKRVTKKEQELLQTQEGAFCAIMGYLKAERGNIPLAVFNKLTEGLGYPKSKNKELKKLAEHMKEDQLLSSIYNKAFDRIIKLDDIPNVINEEKELREQDIFSHVTNFLSDKEYNLANLRELRKLQREGVYMKHLIEGVHKSLREELKGMPRAKYLKTPVSKDYKGKKSLVLAISDWHIGALVFNEETGGYNFEKLTHTVDSIVEKTIQTINELGIEQVYVFHVGDIIEHISMRNVNQAFESEFPATEQIAKATRLLADMLSQISKVAHVTFGMVAGNHDRFDGNKNDKIYNDTVTYLILDNLILLQGDFNQLPNVDIIDNRNDTYEFVQEVAGKKIKVKHGDTEKKKDDVKIPKHIKEEPIDYYILGHIHTSRMIQEDYHRFHIYVGSTMGANNFSKELGLPTTKGSQLLMILEQDSYTPWFIPLMINKEGDIQ